jgi:acetyl esterase
MMATTEDLLLDLPGRRIAARIHRPNPASDGTVLYVHGGGWVVGDLDTHDRIARTLAAEAGATVVAIAYRKAPEHPFPAALHDVIDSWTWINREAATFSLDITALAIAGDSAGANLALAASQYLRALGARTPDAHALFYGVYAADLDTESYNLLGDGKYGLSRADMATYWDLYVPEAARRGDPAVSPLWGSMTGIERPFVMWAALDPLRDDSRKLVQALNVSGQSAVGVEIQSVTHGFLQYSDSVTVARLALAFAGLHIRDAHRKGQVRAPT